MPRGASILVCCLLLLAGAAAASTPRWNSDPPQSLADCDRLVVEDPSDIHSFSCYWFVARNRNLLHEAMRRLETQLQLTPGEPRAQLYLGLLSLDLAQARSEELLLAALAGFEREGHVEGEVFARISVVRPLRERGLHDEASEHLEAALARAESSGDPALEGWVLVNFGWQKYYAREYGAARAYLLRAEALEMPRDSLNLRLDTLDGLAAVSWAMGRMTDALDYYRQQLDLLGGMDPFREGGVRRNMGVVARELLDQGRLDEADLVEIYRGALDATVRSGNRVAEAGVRILLAELLEGPEGIVEAERALRAARSADRTGDTCWALRLLAAKTLRLDPERAEEAFRLVDRAVALAGERGDAEHLAQAMLARATMRWATGPREKAIEDSLAALDAVEGIRELQPAGETRARVFGRYASRYRRLAAALLDVEGGLPADRDTRRALHVMERMRARSLLETLDAAGASGLVEVQGPPTDIVDDVRRALRPGQAMIAYVVLDARPSQREEDGPPDSWALVISGEVVHAVRLPGLIGVGGRIELFLSLLERRDGSERGGAERLFEELLGGPLSVLPEGTSRLVFIPDDTLHALPLGALIERFSGRALAERFEITVVPSAATWLRWKGSRDPAGRIPVLALADPYRPADEFGPLPHARQEATRMGNRLGGASVVLAGKEATERALEEAVLSRFRLIHLAAHALIDDREPERSAVALSPSSPEDDGLLYFREIVELDLDGQVVLLSACRSGSGPIVGGEGVLGLANAFFQARARSVVAGLWPVRDRETAALVDRFGEHLAAGNSVASALALARREGIRRGDPPAAWAGMVVLGDGDVVPFPEGRSGPGKRLWLIALAVVGLLLLGALGVRATVIR